MQDRPRQRPVRGKAAVAGHGRHRLVRVVKVAVAMVSLIVFGATWYGWVQVRTLTTGLTTADVIDPAVQSPLGEQNLLLVGLDTRTDAQGNPLPAAVLNQLHAGATNDGGDTTDTMMVIHIPAGAGQAQVISIPRDSYVRLANGFGQHKINAAYAYGKIARQQQLRAQSVTGATLETQSDQAGARTTIQTVQQLIGLRINHYAAVNLAGFYFISQAVGGVPVCLKASVHDRYSGADFPAGPQSVSGSSALAFVRQRYGLPNGDLDRIKRQQAFMASMVKIVLSNATLTDSAKRNDLIDAIKKTTVLDNGWDVISFAQQLQGMSANDIQFVTIPIVRISLQTPADGDAVEVDPQQVQAFIQQQTNGHSDPTTTGSGSAAHSAVTVDGLNANGQAVTATPRSTTVIDYAPSDETAADGVPCIN
jgi:LCP family protein required for cell wall assembly